MRTVYVFDLDGVVTDPQNSQVDDRVIAAIQKLIDMQVPVAVNTGRSYAWVERSLLSRLRGHENSIIVCEKGGEAVIWNDGTPQLTIGETALPLATYDTVKRVFEVHRTELSTMFWDDEKRTMATIEKRPESDLYTFHEQQTHLVGWLEAAVDLDMVRVDATTIATDVELLKAGKAAGAATIYSWATDHYPAESLGFISLGDSESDYAMARYLAAQGAGSQFVYVGKTTLTLEEHPGVELIVTQQKYAAGALEFLSR